MAIYAELNWVDEGEVSKNLLNDVVFDGVATGKLAGLSALSSNKFLLKNTGIRNQLDYTYRVPVSDNIQVDYQTDFEAVSDKFGGFVTEAIEFVTKASTSTGGTLSALSTYFDFQMWQRTQPLALNIELLFFMETDAFLDVVVPMQSLSNLAVLTRTKNSSGNISFKTPGINLSNFSRAKNTNDGTPNGGKLPSVAGKFLDLRIPGVLTLNDAIVSSATPSYSTYTTRDGSPVSGSLNLRVESIYPANDGITAETLRTIIEKRRTFKTEQAKSPLDKNIILKQSPLGDIFEAFK